LPYAARAIRPQSLAGIPAGSGLQLSPLPVIRTFSVDAGRSRLGSPSRVGGLQYQCDAALVPGAPPTLNVMWLVGNGYLEG
jgi:hypothetical protein